MLYNISVYDHCGTFNIPHEGQHGGTIRSDIEEETGEGEPWSRPQEVEGGKGHYMLSGRLVVTNTSIPAFENYRADLTSKHLQWNTKLCLCYNEFGKVVATFWFSGIG